MIRCNIRVVFCLIEPAERRRELPRSTGSNRPPLNEFRIRQYSSGVLEAIWNLPTAEFCIS